ncbi:MFS transporter [Oceanobacillus neutriphilus]|uniref:MFS-type transporter YvmA n=1 Tax=Oceanobacillus neutriphilus TaxID=531815 RepID=A0ABQ2NR72_9BACI|nr:MFS transporter [Oceanobacillus neutriphilus]GGP08621.1 putative MFS-type transporter YvmA [Oceanobacillus neutriphilus]
MSQKLSQTKLLSLYLLSISSFFVSLNQNIYTPVIPLIRDSFHVSINWVNFTVSSFIFIVALIQIILGTVIDTKNQKHLLILSFILISVSTITCAFATNFTLFMIFRIVQSIGAGIIPLVAINMISHLFDGKTRGSAMGTYQILLTLAPAVAPILGGILGEHFGYQGIFLFLFLIAMVLLMFIIYKLPDNGGKTDSQKEPKNFFQTYRNIFSNKVGLITMTVSFFIFFIYFAIIVFLPILLNDHYHISLQNIGLLYLPLTVSMILGSVIFKRVQITIALRKLFITVIFFMPLLIITFGFLHAKSIIGLSILLFLYGITIGFAPPLFSTVISNEYSENRGAALGLFNFIRYSGMAVGGMFTGLTRVIPSSYIFIFLGALLFLISLFQYSNLKKRAL